MRNIIFFCSVALLAASSLLISCQEKTVETLFPDFKYGGDLLVVDSIDIESLGILNPIELYYKKDFLIFGSNGSKSELQFLDLKSGKVFTKYLIGRGPDEVRMYNVVRTQKNSPKFNMVDPNTWKMIGFDLDSLRADTLMRQRLIISFPRTGAMAFNAYETDRYVYRNGIFRDGRYLCYDKQTGEASFDLDYPFYEDLEPLDWASRGMVFSKTKMVGSGRYLVSYIHGLIDFYEIGDDGKLSLIKNQYYYPKFKYYPDTGSTPTSSEEPERFNSIDSDEEGIYLLYSGKDYKTYRNAAFNCLYLMTYDWKGNPLKEYHLEKSLTQMTINGKTLYGLNREGDPKVYIYKLP